MADAHVQDAVREKYGAIARSVGKTGCCSPAACGCGDPITSDLYSDTETAGLPADAMAVSLGLAGGPSVTLATSSGRFGSGNSRRRGTRPWDSTAVRRLNTAAPRLM